MATGEIDEVELARRQKLELESWLTSTMRNDKVDYTVRVLNTAPALLDLLGKYESSFRRATDVLELGAGSGWGSCIVKSQFPDLRITATDMSPEAISRIDQWERTFDVRVDETRTARSYDTGLPDASMDLVFAFAAAHHFVLHERTFREIARVLRPGGEALYLYEPTCADYVYPISSWRMRKTRSDVVEDVIRRDRLTAAARKAGFDCEVDLYPTMIGRGPLGTIYNAALLRVPPLRRVLWCGANFRFTRPATA